MSKISIEEAMELYAMAEVGSQLPIQFANGRRVDFFHIACPNCQEHIPSEQFRGRITLPVPQTAVVEAVGWCRHCNSAAPVFARIHDDMTMTLPIDGIWRRYKIQSKQHSALRRLKHFISSVF